MNFQRTNREGNGKPANGAAHGALAPYLGRLWEEERDLADAFLLMASRHDRDPEMREGCRLMAQWSQALVDDLEPFVDRYGKRRSLDAEHVRGALFHGSRFGGDGLLRDAQDLALLTEDVKLGWTAIAQAAPELRDRHLEDMAKRARATTQRQCAWLETRIKNTAPNALAIPPDPIAARRASVPRTLSPSTISPAAWAPLAGGALALVVGLLGTAAGAPLLAASFAPTIYVQVLEPAHPSARAWNVAVGHVIALGIGAACTLVFGLSSTLPVAAGGLFTFAHAVAAALALGVTIALAHVAKANHPPAGATALLVVLGALRTGPQLGTFLIGLALVTGLGEALRRARLYAVPPRPA